MHKFAIKDIKIGEKITKYGAAVGTATSDIMTGQHVDTDNIKSLRGQFTKKRVPRKE
jgi:hypothetical protein